MMQTVIGLMSGTSLDGVDAALIRTDGHAAVEAGPWLSLPYPQEFRDRLRSCFGKTEAPRDIVTELTERHAKAVATLLEQASGWGGMPSLIGFHGQTIHHDPAHGITTQIGDGDLLARLTGIAVVDDFRTADVKNGGEGAPLVPLYHQALASGLAKPLLVLNIGGVANITYIGEDELIACDTGPGNALIDDWMLRHTGRAVDEGGAMAAQGRVDPAIEKMLDLPFFSRRPPKSLDRQEFRIALENNWAVADGAATLTALTALCVRDVLRYLPARPQRLLVTGGGRHNPTLMRMLQHYVELAPEPVETVGWLGDALEAQAFGYLALRSRLGEPLSLPLTTGVAFPCHGGIYHPVK